MDLEQDRIRKAKKRQEIIDKLGGKCVICGTTEKLEFDHKDPSTKRYKISASLSWLKLQKELPKIQLLCKKHHQEKTSKEGSVPHGGGVKGKMNCTCDLCRLKNNEYQRNRYNR